MSERLPALNNHALTGLRSGLAAGFLFTEGIIDDVSQILSMRAESAGDSSDDSGDRVTIRLKPKVAIDPGRIRPISIQARVVAFVGSLR